MLEDKEMFDYATAKVIDAAMKNAKDIVTLTTENKILPAGDIQIVTGEPLHIVVGVKIGDGHRHFNDLPYLTDPATGNKIR